MVGAKGKIVTFWRSRSLENAFPWQFHNNKHLWNSLVLYYFGYEVILFQIFFKYQNPENKLSYVTNPEFRINPEIFHLWELKSRSFEDKAAAYNKQRNYCVSFVPKTKTDYYNNFDHKMVVDNKSFSKYIKPYFTNKSLSFNKTTLVEKDLIIDHNEEIAETFNDSLLKQFQIWISNNMRLLQWTLNRFSRPRM